MCQLAYDHFGFSMHSYGGVARYYANLYHHMVDQNISVKVFSPFYKNNYLRSDPKYKKNIFGFHLNYFPKKTTRLFQGMNNIYCASAISLSAPKIIHKTFYSNNEYRCDSVKVITVYDLIDELLLIDSGQSFKIKESKKYKSIVSADHIICISHYTQKMLIDIYNVDEKDTSVIYLGSDNYSKDSVVEIKSQEKPYLLYVGTRYDYKNFDFLINTFIACQLYKKYDLYFFGGGPINSDHRSKITSNPKAFESIKHLNGNDDVLAGLYKNAYCLVYPSRHEGFGLPPLEAMSLGCPVLSSNLSCLPEVLGDAPLFFSPGSVDEFLFQLELLSSINNRNLIIANGYKQSDLYQWNSCSTQTQNLYQTFLS
jgi:glycosyltransferase involved in cell wall biosynthesis